MSLSERDKHLSGVLGIKVEEELLPDIVVEETHVPAIADNLKDALNENLGELNTVLKSANTVLEEAGQTVKDFNKARDVEVFAKLTDAITNIIKIKADINIKKHQPLENDDKNKNLTQNNFYIGDAGELNDLIKGNKKNIINIDDNEKEGDN